jgi:cysteinyl-tRNA synthetase
MSGGEEAAVNLPEALADVDPATAVSALGHPPWYPPTGGIDMGLRVNNSLCGPEGRAAKSDELVPFRPAKGRTVKWYTCGPTVYDACHMGHARAYLTFDILRRIMEDYFGYNVLYHINITDIDDKIIKRARVNKLLADYTTAAADLPTVRTDVQSAVDAKLAKLQGKMLTLQEPLPADTNRQTKDEHETEIKETKLKLGQAELAVACVAAVNEAIEKGADTVLAGFLTDAKALPGDSKGTELGAVLEGLILALERMDDAKSPEQEATLAAAKKIRSLSTAVGVITAKTPVLALIEAGSTELGEVLDAKLGGAVTDHDIFNAHARKWEKSYMDDMKALGIKDPDVLTRVTENVPEIISFVQTIEKKGLAYASNGSVYLSIDAFTQAGHHYRKLKPGHFSEKDMAESEGALGADGGEKKNQNDFALWKASKPGEPEWDSPWGKGRPGWHIECSAIASDILGPYMDIHAGGIDLKFPHHDNELAQSESFHGHHQWVSCFFHAGHLHIKNLKMSKSLKNFVTIQQALQESSARQLRIMFLLQQWDRPMMYSSQAVDNAKKKESRFKEFFFKVKDYLRKDFLAAKDRGIGWTAVDRELHEQLSECQEAVHEALCTNFNTADAMSALDGLISGVNKIFEKNAGGPPEGNPAQFLLEKCGIYVTKILKNFGVIEGNDSVGFPTEGGEGVVGPFVDALLNFREQVRSAALEKADPSVYLNACDSLRDDVLVDMGVRVLDGAAADAGGAQWDMANPAELRKELEDKKAKEAEKAKQKVQRKLDSKIKELAKTKTSAVPPAETYTGQKDLYSAFDETGMPTKQADGEELSKAQVKKLKKELGNKTKAYEKLVKEANGDIPAFIAGIEAEIAALRAQLE